MHELRLGELAHFKLVPHTPYYGPALIAGLHLIAGAQKPSSAALGPMLKANFPVRLVGRVGSADDARVAAGISGTGAEKLLGHGDFLAVASGQVVRFQAAWIPTKDWAQIVAAW